jgi:hypothetical protein
MGRQKMIDSPQFLLELFGKYQDWVSGNPIKVHDFVGKDGDEVYRERQRPLTMEGFEIYVFEQGFNSELSHYFSNKDDRYKDFVAICSHIRRSIRADQISGGMAGIYNPSITQRLNNLVEKIQEDGSKEVTIKVKYADRATSNPE